MLSFRLARLIKSKGYAQSGISRMWYDGNGIFQSEVSELPSEEIFSRWYYVPRLDELLSIMEKYIAGMMRETLESGQVVWVTQELVIPGAQAMIAEGDSLEDSMAMLWCAMNDKPDLMKKATSRILT